VFAKAKTIDKEKDINVAGLTIAADPFLKTEAYQNFLHFKNLKHYIQFITKASDNIVLSPQFENAFIRSNPESYYMYQILGNYYAARKNNAKAIEYYNLALTKEIATLKEERQIRESLKKCQK
jgi:hypothetical protein